MYLCSVYTSVYTREVRGCLCPWTGNFKGLHSLLLMAYKSNPSMCDKTFLNCLKKNAATVKINTRTKKLITK